MTKQHRLYGIFFRSTLGQAVWGMERSRVRAVKAGRANKALVLSMPLQINTHAWDAPTFRACADRLEGDFRDTQS